MIPSYDRAAVQTGRGTSMARLPTELFHHIAEHVANRPYDFRSESINTLFSLRLVSRDVCRAVQDTFLRAFFSSRRYLHTIHGLRDLVRFTSHPVLRKRLRNLGIHVAQPQFWDLERLSPGLLNDVQDNSLNDALLVAYRMHKRAIHETCMELLVTALRNLREAGIRPKLQFTAHVSYYKIFGSSQLHRSLRGLSATEADFERWTRLYDLDTAVEIGLVAMARAGFKPNDLTLADEYNKFAPIGRGAFSLSSATTEEYWIRSDEAGLEATATWSEIESLAVLIDEQHLTTMTGAQPIAPWLQAATSLKKLSLTFPVDSQTSWHLQRSNVEMLNHWLSNARLESLHLENMLFSEDAFLVLLAPHVSMLQILVTKGVEFPAVADCARIFRWIAANMRVLRVVCLGDLWKGDDIVLSDYEFVARDAKSTREGLEKLAMDEERDDNA